MAGGHWKEAGQGGWGARRAQSVGVAPPGMGRGKGSGVPSLQEACGDWDTPQTNGDPHLVPGDAHVPRLHLTATMQTRTSTCESWGQNLAHDTRPRPRGAGSARVPTGSDSGGRTAPAWLTDTTKATPTRHHTCPPVLCGSGDVGPKQPLEPRRGVRRTPAILLAPCPDSAPQTQGRDTPSPCGNQSSGHVAGAGPRDPSPGLGGTVRQKPSCHRGGRVHFSEQMTSPWAP